MSFVVQTDLGSLKRALRETVRRVQAPAEDYIDWESFEQEAEALLQTGMPTKKHLTALVGRFATRARHTYQRAVLSGARFAQERPN